jgi:hypothetical protein
MFVNCPRRVADSLFIDEPVIEGRIFSTNPGVTHGGLEVMDFVIVWQTL